MIRLALLRHGHTPWNRAGRIQGRSDIALDAEADSQLAGLCLPPPWNGAELWSSPLQRAARTAEIVGGRVPRQSVALTEMNWGAWEGARGVDLRADPASGYKDIEFWGWEFRPPGGESLAEMRDRLVPWAESLDRDSVAVCHIGVMRVLLAHALNWSFLGTPPFGIKRNRIYVLSIDPGGWSLSGEPIRLVERAG